MDEGAMDNQVLRYVERGLTRELIAAYHDAMMDPAVPPVRGVADGPRAIAAEPAGSILPPLRPAADQAGGGLRGEGAIVGVGDGRLVDARLADREGSGLTVVDAWPAGAPQEGQCSFLTVAGRAEAHPNAAVLRLEPARAARLFTDGVLDWLSVRTSRGGPDLPTLLASWYPKLRPGGLLLGARSELGLATAWLEAKGLSPSLAGGSAGLEEAWSIRKPAAPEAAIVTLAVGDLHRRIFDTNFRASLEAYARRIGAPLHVFERPWDTSQSSQRRSMAWQKLLLFEQPETASYERLCWIDCDVLATSSAENVFEAVPAGRWGGVLENVNLTPAGDLEQVHRLRKLDGSHLMLNTGVLVLSRHHHRRLLREVYEADVEARSAPEKVDRGWFEQPYLSAQLLMEAQGRLLPVRFNRLVSRFISAFGGARSATAFETLYTSSVFMHWAGRSSDGSVEASDMALVRQVADRALVDADTDPIRTGPAPSHPHGA
jgi:hypothetical protein